MRQNETNANQQPHILLILKLSQICRDLPRSHVRQQFAEFGLHTNSTIRLGQLIIHRIESERPAVEFSCVIRQKQQREAEFKRNELFKGNIVRIADNTSKNGKLLD